MVLIAPDQRLVTFNRRFGELFDLSHTADREHWFAELRPRLAQMFDGASALAERIAGALRDTDRALTEIVAQSWPEPREFELFSNPVRDSDGTYLGRLYVFRDVTIEHEAQRKKSEFVALASHELRAPLTAIKGFIDVLLAGDAGDLTDQQRRFLSITRSSTDRLVALVSDLLDITQIEAGKVELRQALLDIGALIRESVSIFQLQITSRQQQLLLALDEGLPPVWGDAVRLTQVLTNLISNAHKYTPPHGSIQISARCEASWVRIDVQDTGIGLLPDEIDQIFTKFFRAKNRAVADAGGTGLGLAISRLLVELHGGTIEVRSTFGDGATFSVLLPIAEANAHPARSS